MSRVKVNLKNNPYDILISGKEAEFLVSFRRVVKADTVFIVTDKNVAKLHLQAFKAMLEKAGYLCKSAVIEAGETGKSIKSLSFLYDKALNSAIDRKSCVIALGGGVVGDVAGFFAATYMRGIGFVQVPTTLLAMTDSSVGGKTAVNTNEGKNIAGVFYQPLLVWVNSYYLETLAERQIRNGMAEVIKYALIFDRNFYRYLKDLFSSGIISSQDFNYMIYKSCEYKAAVVEKDEKETKGLREILNFGHTLAHAMETYTKYKCFLHGEAVAAGMLFAAKLSHELGFCDRKTYSEVCEILKEAGYVFDFPAMDAQKLAALMAKDKKSVNGDIRFVLLKNTGKAVSGMSADNGTVKKKLADFIKEIRGKLN